MENRVGDTTVFSNARVEKIGNIIVTGYDNVFEESVCSDGMVNVGLSCLGQIDRFSIASSFEVVDPIFVPSVLVIANKGAMRISRERSLTSSAQSKEKGDVAVSTNVG